jgi:hypothetical protein
VSRNPDAATGDLRSELLKLVNGVHNAFERRLLEVLVVLLDFYKGETRVSDVFDVWSRISGLLPLLPYSSVSIDVFHCDARRIPLLNASVDLVVTSPPYINVFNYHQQYRASMEALQWNLLEVAKSEFGSNRKHRSNRFLTVIQYCLDIAQSLAELGRLLRPDSRLIMVVGRESTVMGVPFYNGEIVTEVAHAALGFDLLFRQERVFVNRFGQRIYEDILHLSPSTEGRPAVALELARDVALTFLAAASGIAAGETREQIRRAIGAAEAVSPSPIFDATRAIDQP